MEYRVLLIEYRAISTIGPVSSNPGLFSSTVGLYWYHAGMF